MKNKKCEVLLVSESKKELLNWIEQYRKETISFQNVEHTNIRECIFYEGDKVITDYRTNLTFYSKASKNNVYFLSNQIKSNPIKFS